MTEQLDVNWRVALIENTGQRSSAVAAKLESAFDISRWALDDLQAALADSRPELVILDTDAHADMSIGIRTLKSSEHARSIPLIVIAQSYDPQAEAQALEMGANDYIVRDVVASVLRQRARSRIEAHLYRQHDASASQPSPDIDKLREALFEQSPLTISLRALDGRYLFVNPAAGRFLGARPQDFVGKRPEQTPGLGRQLERHDAIVRTRLEPVEYERVFETPAGDRQMRIIAFPVLDEAGQLQAIGRIGADITDSAAGAGPGIENIEALSRHDAMFTAFLDHAPNVMTVRDLQGRYLMVNNATAQRLGKPKAEMLGRTNAQLGRFSEDTLSKVAAQEKTVIDTRATVTEKRWETERDGGVSERWVTKFPVFDTDGTVLSIGTVDIDLTALGAAERALVEREENFSSLVQGSIQGIAIRRGMQALFVNQAFADIHGYATPGEMLALPDLSTLVLAEDRNRIQAIIEGRARGERVPDRYEYRAVRKDGGEVILQCIVSATRWQGLPATQMAVIDVTDVVRNRRQSELLREAIDASSDATVLYDEQLRIVFTNRRFHSIFTMLPPQREIPSMTREALLRTIAAGRVRTESLSEAEAEAYVQRKLIAADKDAPRSYEHTHSSGRIYLERYFDAGDGGLMLQLQDITERRAAEARLEQYQVQLRRLASEVSLAEERERRRIATELHDGAVQNLGLARIKLGAMVNASAGTASPAKLGELRDLLAQSIRELRSLMSELSPPMLYELGLAPAVQWLAQRMREQYGLDCGVVIAHEPQRLPVELSVVLFQSIRELLMNVVKHAEASHADVAFGSANGVLEVVVVDDGRGIDPQRAVPRPSNVGGFGLFNMRERLALMGGAVAIESAAGTRVTLSVPIEAAGTGSPQK